MKTQIFANKELDEFSSHYSSAEYSKLLMGMLFVINNIGNVLISLLEMEILSNNNQEAKQAYKNVSDHLNIMRDKIVSDLDLIGLKTEV